MKVGDKVQIRSGVYGEVISVESESVNGQVFTNVGILDTEDKVTYIKIRETKI